MSIPSTDSTQVTDNDFIEPPMPSLGLQDRPKKINSHPDYERLCEVQAIFSARFRQMKESYPINMIIPGIYFMAR